MYGTPSCSAQTSCAESASSCSGCVGSPQSFGACGFCMGEGPGVKGTCLPGLSLGKLRFSTSKDGQCHPPEAAAIGAALAAQAFPLVRTPQENRGAWMFTAGQAPQSGCVQSCRLAQAQHTAREGTVFIGDRAQSISYASNSDCSWEIWPEEWASGDELRIQIEVDSFGSISDSVRIFKLNRAGRTNPDPYSLPPNSRSAQILAVGCFSGPASSCSQTGTVVSRRPILIVFHSEGERADLQGTSFGAWKLQWSLIKGDSNFMQPPSAAETASQVGATATPAPAPPPQTADGTNWFAYSDYSSRDDDGDAGVEMTPKEQQKQSDDNLTWIVFVAICVAAFNTTGFGIFFWMYARGGGRLDPDSALQAGIPESSTVRSAGNRGPVDILALETALPSCRGKIIGKSMIGETCSVCIGDYELSEIARTLPCGHSFHKSCIDIWLGRTGYCPICRKPVLVGITESQAGTEAPAPIPEEPEPSTAGSAAFPPDSALPHMRNAAPLTPEQLEAQRRAQRYIRPAHHVTQPRLPPEGEPPGVEDETVIAI
ncbi:unnamed protein product [Polarella glacialis]|uniref:RING-type domain-containing protein n=1 Tax=Polarella glacialis TaxID=89957 RepID=A0A813GAE8_POLGL|nr:unnamed protein product [Polarella glacialis]